ncbi:MAG TPA: response regulator transcription factor [Victivallales bacterium]|nr:response regulator transcription factor [Victivallales bacterium]
MNKSKILLVDDEKDIADLIAYNLKKADFLVHYVKSGEACLEIVKEFKPDVILLDIMMPGISGIETCRRLKEHKSTKSIPVIMLTAKSTEIDIVHGLNSGADDYITKPFSIKVLLARINAMIRRDSDEEVKSEIFSIGDLIINNQTREVFLGKKKIELTYSRFEILLLFINNPNKVFSRNGIVKKIKGDDYPVTARSIDVHIVELRKKLGDFGKNIETVRGVGYKMRIP